MIGTTKLNLVHRLLDEGVPKAEIARRAEIDRHTVHDISVGIERRRTKDQPAEPRQPRVRKHRCPSCGHKCERPDSEGKCLACSLFGPPEDRRITAVEEPPP